MTEFRDWRNLRENEILKTQPHRKGTLEKRLSYLESLFQSGKFGLDTGVKCKPVTSDKFGAVLKHPTVCPITGKILRGDNMDIDHVPAKSISSENNFVPIERGANRRKGNVDAEFQQKTLAYHIKHEASPIQVAPVQSDTASTSVAADSGSGL